jgi:hypothetical protein
MKGLRKQGILHNIYPMPTTRVKRERTSAVTTPKANSTVPPIYRLPTEVLLLIFILVSLPDDNPRYANLVPIHHYPMTGHVKPILVLRWVSVWFRKMASHPTLCHGFVTFSTLDQCFPKLGGRFSKIRDNTFRHSLTTTPCGAVSDKIRPGSSQARNTCLPCWKWNHFCSTALKHLPSIISNTSPMTVFPRR